MESARINPKNPQISICLPCDEDGVDDQMWQGLERTVQISDQVVTFQI